MIRPFVSVSLAKTESDINSALRSAFGIVLEGRAPHRPAVVRVASNGPSCKCGRSVVSEGSSCQNCAAEDRKASKASVAYREANSSAYAAAREVRRRLLQQCADEGLTLNEAAKRIGMHYVSASRAAAKMGIKFRRQPQGTLHK